MLRVTEIRLPLDHSQGDLCQAIIKKLRISPTDLRDFSVIKRGQDARKKSAIVYVYSLDVAVADEASVLAKGLAHVRPAPDMGYKLVTRAPQAPVIELGASAPRAPEAPIVESGASAPRAPEAPIVESGASAPGAPEKFQRPLVVGAGPCGLFAALVLAQMGFKPIILERGKAVRQRTKDTWALWRHSVLTPESNVQFGEGGAGTFSDGKLYSQIKDPRHLGRKVLSEFVKAGAPPEILTDAHPHIGTFRLVTMVESLRATIERLGGEYRFQSKVTDLLIENGHMRGARLESGEEISSDHVVLAVGHSARDVFQLLLDRGVAIEAKPFSIGLRIEHPQSMIDKARFGASKKELGAAEYRLVHHAANGRDVYSFCMCPGGTVVAATSEERRVVTNGMSQYSRNERNANAGIVVAITPDDYAPHGEGPLAGIALQRHWETQAFIAGGETYAAPAQRVGDFLAGRASTALGSVTPSYRPGVTPTDLSSCLPDYAIAAIREALTAFGRQLRGFDMGDAVLTGVETRTSSPVRISRGEDFQSLNTRGLYPAGEGAGYAGGILSAGVDGIKVAEAVALDIVARACL